jgi:putative membrane protein
MEVSMTRKLMWGFFAVFVLLNAYTAIILRLNWTGLANPILTPITTLFGFAFALTHAALRKDWRAALTLFLISFVVSLSFESIGVASGLVYGPYHYTAKLGPKFLGLVPYIIPAAWFMMMYPSLVIAERIAPQGNGWKRGLTVAALGGVIMTAWDVVMDPMMVHGGHWVWEVNGPYFGVRLQNYWGWWLTTFTVFLVYWLVIQIRAGTERTADDRIAVAGYIVMAVSTVLACTDPDVIAVLGGAALAGIFAMSPWAVMGWLKAGE